MIRKMVAVAVLAAMSSPVAAETPAATKAKTANPMEKVVCRSEVETGSLVAKRKVCKSKADWDREQLRTRDSLNPTQSCGGDAARGC